jgi:hypothetical protein
MGRRARIETREAPRARRLGPFVALLLLCAPARAVAQPQPAPPAPSQANRDAAAAAFAEGERAFAAGDYQRAARSFAQAYALAPHPAALWNTARAWHEAGELARAANLFAKYLREAPAGAPDRGSATKALEDLSRKLGRIDVFAPGLADVRVDDTPADGGIVYVSPGTHVIRARAKSGVLQRTREVEAGAVIEVALVGEAVDPASPPRDPAPPPAASTPLPLKLATPPGEGSLPTPPAPTQPSSRGWSPIVVSVGVAVTAVLAGVTIGSGVDTLNTRDRFDRNPIEANRAAGEDAQLRTNVLLGVTIGSAALTAVAAIWLVEWSTPTPSARGAPKSHGAR